MPEPGRAKLANDEILARFVVYSDHVRKQDRSPKPDLFMPDRSHACSVFNLAGLVRDHALKRTSDEVGMSRRGRPAYGYCPITIGAALATSAVIDPNDEPKHHVNIAGYPPANQPQLIKDRALALAQAAKPMIDNYLNG